MPQRIPSSHFFAPTGKQNTGIHGKVSAFPSHLCPCSIIWILSFLWLQLLVPSNKTEMFILFWSRSIPKDLRGDFSHQTSQRFTAGNVYFWVWGPGTTGEASGNLCQQKNRQKVNIRSSIEFCPDHFLKPNQSLMVAVLSQSLWTLSIPHHEGLCTVAGHNFFTSQCRILGRDMVRIFMGKSSSRYHMKIWEDEKMRTTWIKNHTQNPNVTKHHLMRISEKMKDCHLHSVTHPPPSWKHWLRKPPWKSLWKTWRLFT